MLDDRKIGNLEAEFHFNRRHRVWELPLDDYFADHNHLKIETAIRVDLPLHQLKCLLRYLLIESPDLSQAKPADIYDMAKRLHAEQTRKTREITTKRVQFRRKFDNNGNPGIGFWTYLDDSKICYLSPGDLETNPVWKPDYELFRHLHLPPRTKLPFLLFKSLIRHIVSNSIEVHDLVPEQILVMAEYARNQEMAVKRLPSR